MTARSLRQIVGLAPIFQPGSALAADKTALLLIDYQQEYRQGPLALPDEATASAVARCLRAWAEAAGLMVIHVQHRVPAGSLPFADGSPGSEALPGLAPTVGQSLIAKRLPSSFAGTDLAEVLQCVGIDTLLLAGFMTHNCVDATARDAFHRGYRVGIVADACATRDLPGVGGTTVPAAVLHGAVLAGLGDRIAEIVELATLEAMSVG